MNTHIKINSYANGDVSVSEQNVVHISGEIGDKVINLDFDKALLYTTVSPDVARDIAAALIFVADELEK